MTTRRLLLSLCLLVANVAAASAQTITVNGEAPPTEVAVGAATSVTVALTGGPGNATDWIALYPVGAPDSGYLRWSYLSGTGAPPSSGLTSGSITTYAPLSAGTYEWRLFANGGWTKIATSTALTVTASPAVLTVNGVAPPTDAAAVSGSTIAVSLAGGPGNPTDWIGLAPAGSSDSTLVDWRYLNGTTVPPATGQTTGAVQFLAPATAGSYEIRFFAHGTFGRLAASTVNVSASAAALTINGTAPPTAVPVSAGTYVSVGVTDGPAQPGDWVGLFGAGAPDTANVAWNYLNGAATIPSNGQTDATLTFAVPVTAGSYEFRFFNAGTFTRLATSTTMVVSASASALTVNGVSAPATATAASGSQAVVGVAGGPGNAGDWVGLYLLGATDSTVLDWRYLNDTAQLPSSGLSTATLHFGVPTTPGTYELRFFTDGGYNRLATSGPVAVPETVAQVSVNGVAPPTSVSVEPGSAVTIAITGGPANPTDWVALAATGATDSTYIAWQYLNGSLAPPNEGLASATLTFTLPSTAGSYEVRLFAHGSYQRITTSGLIVASSEPAAVSVALIAPFPGTIFSAPSSLLLAATASISGGTLGRVEFYSGTTLLGSASAPPYQASWVTPPEGVHVLTAAAVDSDDAITTSAPVTITIASSGSSHGTLGAPIANPPSGVYGVGQTIELTAAAGSTIRYTVDGSQPTEASSVYTAPLTVTQQTTVRARAYQSDWTQSEVATHTYRIDTAPPTIVATMTPVPNPAGWNNGPVTVSFQCVDESAVATCPAPVVVSQEGAGQLVTVSALDVLGFQGNLTVTVNIDSQPPSVSLTAPTAAVSTTDATLVLSGTATDVGAGLVSASCNGQWANPSGGAFSCAVPLVPGQNTVIVSAIGLAGNSASAGIRATRVTPPTSLSISPTTVTVAPGDTKTLTVTTNTGLPATGLTWESDNPSVVAIGPDNDGTITGETVGVATITAGLGGLTAEAIVRVLPGGVAIGEAIWTTAPSPARYMQGAVRANRVLDEDPDIFAFEADAQNPSNTTLVVKAVRGADGATLWSQTVDQIHPWPYGSHPVPDAFGGLLVKGFGGFIAEYPEYPAETLRRIGNDVVAPWEYVSEEQIGPVAVAPDGTVYLVEFGLGNSIPPTPREPYVRYDEESFFVALDGRTGAVKFRLPVPTRGLYELTERTNSPEGGHSEDNPPWVEPIEQCEIISPVERNAGTFGSILVLPNGDAFVQQRVAEYRNTTRCPGLVPGTAFERLTLTLLHVTAGGAMTSRILADSSGTFPTNLSGGYDPVGLDRFTDGLNHPDGRGGVLASWARSAYDGTSSIESFWTTEVSSAGGLTARLDPGLGSQMMVSSLGAAYQQESELGLMARDTSTWAPLWPAPIEATPAYPLNNGGLIVLAWDETYGPVVQEISAAGAVVQSYPSAIYSPLVVLRDQGLLHGIDMTGRLAMTSIPVSVGAEWTFSQGAYTSCTPGILTADVSTTDHIGLQPQSQPYLYRFQDFPSPDPRHWLHDQIEGVKLGFDTWNVTSSQEGLTNQQGLQVTFRELTAKDIVDGKTAAIVVMKSAARPNADGFFSGSEPYLPSRRITSGGLFFNQNTNRLFSDMGYFKTTLHEIGHMFGLAHPTATVQYPDGQPSVASTIPGGTVMNPNGAAPAPAPLDQRRDDFLNFVAFAPTACDVTAVKNALKK